jgi:hypothetical protein
VNRHPVSEMLTPLVDDDIESVSFINTTHYHFHVNWILEQQYNTMI